MQLVDSHCHIQDASLELLPDSPMRTMWSCAARPDPVAMLAYAREQSVNQVVCAGTTAADSQAAALFATQHNCFASIGLHPHEANSLEQALPLLRQLLQDNTLRQRIVAIGECGLDYYNAQAAPHIQQIALRAHIELALEYNLPLIFHVREAFDDFWSIFDSYTGLRGVLHSYTDTAVNLEKALQRELFIGLNGIMTFTKLDWQKEVARTIPLDKLLLETDAPFLTPIPLRGTINEPAYVRLVAVFLAQLRGERLEDLARATTDNASHLFGL